MGDVTSPEQGCTEHWWQWERDGAGTELYGTHRPKPAEGFADGHPSPPPSLSLSPRRAGPEGEEGELHGGVEPVGDQPGGDESSQMVLAHQFLNWFTHQTDAEAGARERAGMCCRAWGRIRPRSAGPG